MSSKDAGRDCQILQPSIGARADAHLGDLCAQDLTKGLDIIHIWRASHHRLQVFGAIRQHFVIDRIFVSAHPGNIRQLFLAIERCLFVRRK